MGKRRRRKKKGFRNLIRQHKAATAVIALFLNDRMLRKYYQIQQYALPVFMAVVVLVPYIFHFNPIGIYLNATAGNLASLIAPFYF